jgi:hypothetical protein
MRMNFVAEAPSNGSGPVSITIKPSFGLTGEFVYLSDRVSLLRLLRKETELQSTVLERFDMDLAAAKRARLLGVDISDRALTQLGYFVD